MADDRPSAPTVLSNDKALVSAKQPDDGGRRWRNRILEAP
jgi:hypothetical protein